MSTQAPKLLELVLRAGTASPRLRTDRRTLTSNIVRCVETGLVITPFIVKQKKITPGINFCELFYRTLNNKVY